VKCRHHLDSTCIYTIVGLLYLHVIQVLKVRVLGIEDL